MDNWMARLMSDWITGQLGDWTTGGGRGGPMTAGWMDG